VKAPGFGDRRKAMLQDVAILTGGTVIAEETGFKLEKATLAEMAGAAHRGGQGQHHADRQRGRAEAIKAGWRRSGRRSRSDQRLRREQLEERAAKLAAASR